MVSVCLTLGEAAKFFQKVCFTLPQCMRIPGVPHPHQHLILSVVLFYFSHSVGGKCCLMWLMISSYFFMCLFAIYISFWWSTCSDLLPINWVICFPFTEFLRVLFIFWKKFFVTYIFCKYLLPVHSIMACLLILLGESYIEHE